MGQTLDVTLKRFNGTDSDNLLTTPAQHASTHSAEGTDPITVGTGVIANLAVTEAKIADNAVSVSKIKGITTTDVGKYLTVGQNGAIVAVELPIYNGAVQ